MVVQGSSAVGPDPQPSLPVGPQGQDAIGRIPWSMVNRRTFPERRSTEKRPLDVPAQSRPSCSHKAFTA